MSNVLTCFSEKDVPRIMYLIIYTANGMIRIRAWIEISNVRMFFMLSEIETSDF